LMAASVSVRLTGVQMSSKLIAHGLSVDTLPLAGRDQGWGRIGHYIGALAPPPSLPRRGGGIDLWVGTIVPAPDRPIRRRNPPPRSPLRLFRCAENRRRRSPPGWFRRS